MRRINAIILMVLGVVLISAALVLLIHNKRENTTAKKNSDHIFNELQVIINSEERESIDDLLWPKEGNGSVVDTNMTVVEVDGYGYIGTISIPELNLNLPVMSEWSYDRLRIAPCRYYGSTKTDNLVIAAHNYDNHFGRIVNCSIDSYISFTDMDNYTRVYRVENVEILDPYAVDEMIGTDYELTLYTCTYGGANRATVRCRLINE